jgi:hypothetical protein
MDFGILVLLAPLWPLIAIGSAVFFYVHHSRRIEPARRIPLIVYIAGVIIAGGVTGILGLGWGIRSACSGPRAGNLCGLFGFLVAGPIAGTLGVILVGSALSLIRPE